MKGLPEHHRSACRTRSPNASQLSRLVWAVAGVAETTVCVRLKWRLINYTEAWFSYQVNFRNAVFNLFLKRGREEKSRHPEGLNPLLHPRPEAVVTEDAAL